MLGGGTVGSKTGMEKVGSSAKGVLKGGLMGVLRGDIVNGSIKGGGDRKLIGSGEWGTCVGDATGDMTGEWGDRTGRGDRGEWGETTGGERTSAARPGEPPTSIGKAGGGSSMKLSGRSLVGLLYSCVRRGSSCDRPGEEERVEPRDE